MNIEKIDHIAINVADMGRSLDFYGGILGFELLQTIDCGTFEITYLALPGGSRLELFDHHDQQDISPRQERDTGLRHLAFQVKDVAKHEILLRAAGVEITLPTCDLPDLGVRVLLFLDPNGVTIEFCERL